MISRLLAVGQSQQEHISPSWAFYNTPQQAGYLNLQDIREKGSFKFLCDFWKHFKST